MDYKLKTNYRSSEDRQPGAIWDTNRSGKFEIIGKIDDGTGKHYLIRFLNTGHEQIVSGSAFKTGTIRDPYARIAKGIGYIGEGPYSYTKNKKEGTLWHNMLVRCYDPKYWEKCPTYIGCEVCERWQNFQNFCEDLPKLEGYDKWIKSENKYALDKDIRVPGNKIYSLDTCMFVYEGDNTRASNKSVSIYKGISPSGDIFYFRNQRIFAEKHNLERRGISAVVSGDQQSHRKWKFKRLTEEEVKEINLDIIQD